MPHGNDEDEILKRIDPLALHPDPIPGQERRTRNQRIWTAVFLAAAVGAVTCCWFWPVALLPALFVSGFAFGISNKIGFDIKYTAGPKNEITPYLREVAGVCLGFTVGGAAGCEILKLLL